MFFGCTRFSVFTPSSPGWHLSKGALTPEQVEKYRSALFAPERMDERFSIFFDISMPLIDAMRKGHDYVHVLQYSDQLPAEYKQTLFREAAKYDFLRLQEINATGASALSLDQIIVAEMKGRSSDVFALFNLDDDDLLGVDFLKIAEEYVDASFVGKVVSFGLGVSAYLSENFVFSNVREIYFPKINIGMLRVGRLDRKTGSLTMPVIGNHAFVDKYSPTILDSRSIAYFWVRHMNQDSARSHSELIAQRNNIMTDLDRFPKYSNLEELKRLFPTARFREADAQQTILPVKDVPVGPEFATIPFSGNLADDFEISYELACEGMDQGNPRGILVSFLLAGADANFQAPGIVKSTYEDIGYFKYIQTTPGSSVGTITLSLPPGVELTGIRFKLWHEKAKVMLSRIGYRML